MNKLLKLRKSKKGFTLVELLVVIVIIAILMAAIIPSMIGFIDKAKEETAKAECKNILLAANVVLNEEYGLGHTFGPENIVDNAASAAGKAAFTKINTMAKLEKGSITNLTVEVDGAGTDISAATYAVTDGGKLFYYHPTTGGWDTTAPTP